MKYTSIPVICFTCIAAFVLINCTPDSPAPYYGDANSLSGVWELRMQAGMTPAVEVAPGSGNKLIFTDSTYERYTNGQLTKKGVYRVLEDTTVSANVCLRIPFTDYPKRIVYDNNDSATFLAPKTFFKQDNNSLSFIAGCYAYDAGHREKYERIAAVESVKP